MRNSARLSTHTAAIFLAFVCNACTGSDPPVKVGVLLPLTGAAASGYEEALAFARDEINRAGGVRGRPIELVFQDTGTIPSDALDAPRREWELSKTFLADPDIDVVIGADDDDATFAIAPSFIKAQKVLISPTAAGVHLSRGFSDSGFIRRTIASDASRAEIMLLLAKRMGAKTLSVLATSSWASTSFFDWIPYHAEELGLEVQKALRTGPGDPECANAIEQVKSFGAPDVLFLFPDTTAQAECMVRKAREMMPTSQLFMNDVRRFTGLLETLGPAAEGMVGVSVEAPLQPSAGPPFKQAYEAKYGHAPPPFAANVFDALALAAYGLQRANGATGLQLVAALDEVVKSRGEITGWNRDGMARAFELLEAGRALPDVTGASGGLSFSQRSALEVTSAGFALWQIRGGVLRWDQIDLAAQTIPFPENHIFIDEDNSALEDGPAHPLRTIVTEEATGYLPAARKGAWAFIAAFSGSLENYRHQADALAMYRLLKARGFTDDRIVLVLADDIASATANPEAGVVRNVAQGPNLRTDDVQIDYQLGNLTPAAVLGILEGKTTAETPAVVASTANDDVFVYWVGHGGDTGVLVGDSAHMAEAVAGDFITPWAFAAAVERKFGAGGYRQMVIVLDSCHAGAMGQALTTPGALLLAGAAPHENSYATNYSGSTNIWYADGFSWALSGRIAAAPDSSLVGLYDATYLDVRGSHPRMYNAGRFGQASTVTIGSILTP